MKARPIPFSGALPLAIREGRKTQTRRVVKWKATTPGLNLQFSGLSIERLQSVDGPVYVLVGATRDSYEFRSEPMLCPYGQPGDLLWVREDHYRYGHWEPVAGALTPTGRQKWAFVPDSSEVRFDAPPSYRRGRHHRDPWAPAWHKRLGRFMPRWASRTTLRLAEVRVERLQDISEADAAAEGLDRVEDGAARWGVQGLVDSWHYDPRQSYRALWESINGPESWDANPWVWALTFEVIKANVDAVLIELAESNVAMARRRIKAEAPLLADVL